jgi:hypothetical protein
MDRAVDELGLTLENRFLTVYLTAPAKALVFRVLSRTNRGYERLNYGPLPLKSGSKLMTFEGTEATIPADGVIPARSYTPTGLLWPTIIDGVYDSTNMWYISEEWREMLFELNLDVTPKTIRTQLEIPKGTKQAYFQKTKVALDVSKDWGWKWGKIETVQFPAIHYGWLFANELNIPLYTNANFTYAEEIVEIPENPELIFDILVGKLPSHWITIPIKAYTAELQGALTKLYGFDGFPLYLIYQKQEAIKQYGELLKEALI